MSYDKYYDTLFIDNKLNRDYVTYLATKHISNILQKKDKNSNVSLMDTAQNYLNRLEKLSQKSQFPLCFLCDDIYDIYLYTKPHLANILNNPKQSIVKENKLVEVTKLKSIPPKTLVWLADKPGSSFREKLAQANKVSTPVKRFSYNVQANQVVKTYYKKLYKLLQKKIDIMQEHRELFGDDIDKEIEIFKRQLYKLNNTIKDIFSEVVEKDCIKPNNTLLGNVDYLSVWNSFDVIKHSKIDIDNVFEKYKQALYQYVILSLMAEWNYIEQPLLLDELEKHILYNFDKDFFSTINFEKDDMLTVHKITRQIRNGVLINNDSSSAQIEIIRTEDDAQRGIAYTLFINSEEIGIFYADLKGVKETADCIVKFLNIGCVEHKIKEKVSDVDYLSINCFDNAVYGNTSSNAHCVKNSVVFEPNELYFVNDNNIYLSSTNKAHYNLLIKQVLDFKQNVSGKFVIYDIQDTFDEFSQMDLRKCMSAVYGKSYPVWRSILAGESIEKAQKEKVSYVVDLCGKEFSISKLKRKNGKFVHVGAIELPLYLSKYNECDFYKEYLDNYQSKYNVIFPSEVIEDLIFSGRLNNLFETEQTLISCFRDNNAEFYCVIFDSVLYQKLVDKFLDYLNVINDQYINSIFIVPNFINFKKMTAIKNSKLVVGAKIIAGYIENREVAWYEQLPDLSLEVIKNGMYDELVLVENRECENIIGKRVSVDIQETFTLSKGESNYILPLNKSFVGEQNSTFVAKIADKSFPLDNDVQVRLHIEYAFGTENSYRLFFIPTKSENAPFSKIEAVWEKEEINYQLIQPKLKKTKYTEKNIQNEIDKFTKTAEQINSFCEKGYTNVCDSFIGDIRHFVFRYGRLINYSNEVQKEVKKILKPLKIENSLKYIMKCLNNEQKGKLEVFFSALATFDPKVDYFIPESKFAFRHPEYSYGYAIAVKSDAKLNRCFITDIGNTIAQKNYLFQERIHQLISSASNIVACNYLRISELCESDVVFCKTLLRYIIKILKDISDIDFFNLPNLEIKRKERFYRNVAFTIRQCLEVILSFLFCREKIVFKDLLPNGKDSKQLIYLYKKLSRTFYNNITQFDGCNITAEKMKTKYNMYYEDKDNKLYNMWREAFCLILYLSGDDRANYITLGDSNDR